MGQSLSTRIATRIELISKWLKGKVPSGLENIPTTLNGWREYHNPELGILRIGSKAGFTTTDPDCGTQVLRLQQLIKALNAKMGVEVEKSSPSKKRKYKPETTRRREAEHERDCALRDVKTVTGHWHVARNQLAKASKDADEYKATVLELHDKIREQDNRIQYLLGRLRSAGLREV
ncbi:hypothetical protein [Rhizobium anhuiense]